MSEWLGTATKSYQNGDGSILSVYEGKSRAEYDAVYRAMERDGYTLYSQNSANGSDFRTFVKGTEMYHVSWLNDRAALHIVHSATAAATLPQAVPEPEESGPVTLTQMKLTITEKNKYANGMGYVVCLSDGSFLVWDGGYATEAEQLMALLHEQNTRDEILIRAWIITHAHGDHTGCVEEFAKTYADEVRVERFMIAALGENDVHNTAKYYQNTFPAVASQFEGAVICTVHTGMTFDYAGFKLEILHAPETLYVEGKTGLDFNNTSVVTRLVGKGDSMIFLGDAMSDVTDRLTSIWGESLKTNMVQIAHHGVGNSTAAFYHAFDADILFYPCGEKLYQWEYVFADNINRNGAVRRELDESGKYIILKQDTAQIGYVWGSGDPKPIA